MAKSLTGNKGALVRYRPGISKLQEEGSSPGILPISYHLVIKGNKSSRTNGKLVFSQRIAIGGNPNATQAPKKGSHGTRSNSRNCEIP